MSGRARLEPLRALGCALALGLLVLVSSPARPAGAGESRAAATQDGWWNRVQGPAEGEPDGNPIRPLVPAVPKPPNVPADAIAVSATAGQADKIAAVGIDLALSDGASVDGLVLRLKEAEGNGANFGADKAKVVACPATGPWGPGQNAAWRDRPVADCGLGSAAGTRGDDGVWTFDLAAIGRLWADPSTPLAANGVVLAVDPASSPSSVQISWLNVDSGEVAIELTATLSAPAGAPAESGPADAAPVAAEAALAGPSPVTAAAASGALPSGGAAAQPFASSFGSGTAGALTPTGLDTVAPAETGSPAEVALNPPPDGTPPALQARPAVDFWEHVPAPTALLVPVALVLAVLLGVALGPAGRPSPVFRREGGLSRALARRSPGGADAA